MITPDVLYKISCDRCDKVAHNHKGGSFFKTEYEALETLKQYGWRKLKDKHYCPECYSIIRKKK